MKKFLKKAEGFTLVELIVVIAILGILAGVAVPAYTGYITKANQSADIATLDAIKTAATAALAEKGEVTKVVVTASSVTATAGSDYVLTSDIANETCDEDFDTYYSSSFSMTFKSKVGNNTATTATWQKGSNNNEWVFS